jgi:MHS family proline/betaine transporter-like MFS transporter
MFELISNPLSATQAFGVNFISLFLSVCVFYPFAGMLSDHFGRRRVMTIGGLVYGLLSPILLTFIGQGKMFSALFSQSVMGTFLALWGAPMMAWLAESFPPETRLTSVSLGYNVGVCIAGAAPAIATCLVDIYGPESPGILLFLLAVGGLSGLWLAPIRPEPQKIFANEGVRLLQESIDSWMNEPF